QAGHKSCCTGIIGRECADLFDIDVDCVLREAGSARLFAPSGEFIRVSKPEPQAYIVDRILLDRSLARKAEEAGAELRLSSKVTRLSVNERGAELTVSRNGESLFYRGETAVIANGFASTFPHELGLGRIKKNIGGAQAVVRNFTLEEVEVHFGNKIAPGFFAWAVPVSAQQARVGLMAREKPGEYLRLFLSKLAHEGKTGDMETPFSYGGIPLKTLPRTYGDRALVVGDAAGQVKPTTGGGIYFGLLCADFAADCLESAFSASDFSRDSMALYEKMWRKKLGHELRIDSLARSVYNRLSDKRINDIFTIARDNNIHESLLASSYHSFDWHGELVLDGMKRLSPWWQLFGRYLPNYLIQSVRNRV
ncbi:MAG: NAD(P)/FAD-dependent oxidoreductase, partial [Dehalococcoidia bacterium]